MRTQRILKTSKSILMTCDRVVIELSCPGRYVLRCERNGNAAYLHGGESLLEFSSIQKASKFVSRHRPEVEQILL